MGIISLGFDITEQLLIRYFCIHQIQEKKWLYNGTVHQVLIDFKKAQLEGKCYTTFSLSSGYP
jgi:hypothetical protein